MTPFLWQKFKKEIKSLLMKVKESTLKEADKKPEKQEENQNRVILWKQRRKEVAFKTLKV